MARARGRKGPPETAFLRAHYTEPVTLAPSGARYVRSGPGETRPGEWRVERGAVERGAVVVDIAKARAVARGRGGAAKMRPREARKGRA